MINSICKMFYSYFLAKLLLLEQQIIIKRSQKCDMTQKYSVTHLCHILPNVGNYII